MPIPSAIRDTSPEAESVLIHLLRAKPGCTRLKDAVNASNRIALQCKNAIRRNHPVLSEEEVDLRFIEINYGQSISEEVRAYLGRRR